MLVLGEPELLGGEPDRSGGGVVPQIFLGPTPPARHSPRRHPPNLGGESPYHFPLNSAFRFSRKARTPSALSSLPKVRQNRSVSRSRPSRRFIRAAVFTASLAIRSAIGLF